MIQDKGYPDFDEYIRQGEPSKREAAYAWSTAIGLQAVDGLKTSAYLNELARRNIEGEITMDEVSKLLDTYYKSKTVRETGDKGTEEADKASKNIKKILSVKTFDFSTNGYISIHRRIFDGVLLRAGKLRNYDITKKEWILKGDSVNYLNWEDLHRALDYDIQNEKKFDLTHLSMDEFVRHICRFVSGLWQIHAFGEGNTRTMAVFTIQYLRFLGFDVDNDLFAKHSWYFRNALVRANYSNYQKQINEDFSFVERFFRNLLMGENNELKNRYMVINPPKEWGLQVTPSTTPSSTPSSSSTTTPSSISTTTPSSTPSTTPSSSLLFTPSSTPSTNPSSTKRIPDLLNTENELIKRLIKVLGHELMSIKQMLEGVGLKDRMNFLEYNLNPAISEGYIRLLYPDKPHHPRQKYLLTVKGSLLYNELINLEN